MTDFTIQDIKKIVQAEMDKREMDNQFSLGPIPNHSHNGVDSPIIQGITGLTIGSGAEWTQTSTFTSDSATQVSWGAGSLLLADGTTYAISAGNTGTMSALTYIYFDPATSTTTYQHTTVQANTIGINFILIGVAKNDTTNAVYNLTQGTLITADNIQANSIAASKLIAGQLIVGTNVGLGLARQNFTSTPVPPYYVGDLWSGGSAGDLKVCITQRLTGSYNASDWDLASKYQSAGQVTTIIGNTVTTGFVNALSVTAGSVAATNITGDYITGKTIRTDASSTFRAELRKKDEAYLPNSLTWVSSANVDLASIQGTTVGALQVFSTAGQTLALGDISNNIGLLNGKIVGDLIPSLDNYFNLGDATHRWKILQYSTNRDFTGSGSADIYPGFCPKEVSLNGYLFYNAGNGKYGTTTGKAGVVDPTTGKCNVYIIEGGTLNITIGYDNYLGGFSTCYCYVSAWYSDHITITYVCPSNWTLGSNLIITG